MDDLIITDIVDVMDSHQNIHTKDLNTNVSRRKRFFFFILLYGFTAAILILLYNLRTSPLPTGATVNFISSTNTTDINQGAITTNSEIYLNINTATAEDLITLNGIGKELAQRIVDYRQEFGAFSCIEEIMNVKGIGEKLFSKIKKFIYVDEPLEKSTSKSTCPPSTTIVTTTTTTISTTFPLDINTASMEELMQLKGIGEVLAARIIDYRENVAPFGDESDIMQVSGIGESTYNNIKTYIIVSAADRTAATTAKINKASNTSSSNQSGTTLTTTTLPRVGSIEINTATYTQLMTIPHMTDEIASGILFHIENALFFSNIEELLTIPGVGNEKYNQIHIYFNVDKKFAEEYDRQQQLIDIRDREMQEN